MLESNASTKQDVLAVYKTALDAARRDLLTDLGFDKSPSADVGLVAEKMARDRVDE